MVRYQPNPPLDNRQLNDLFVVSWNVHAERDFEPVLAKSLGYVAAFETERLIGFVNVAWDGGQHAFLLDTTVHPQFQRIGIGTELVKQAVEIARRGGVAWLHVDFEPRFAELYLGACGFTATAAGILVCTRPAEISAS